VVAHSDLLYLPCSPDLIEAGVAYACRELVSSARRIGGSLGAHLHNEIARVVIELALRRHLSEQKIPFSVLDAEPFSTLTSYDIALGGHRCEVVSALISRRNQILSLHRDPALLLRASALVPLDRFVAEGRRSGDLYLFAFLLGLTAVARSDLQKALAAGQLAYLLHPLPDGWARPVNWLPLPDLALKSECDAPVTLTLGGLDEARDYMTISVELPPRKRIVVPQTFYSLAYLHADRRPEARIGVHSPRCGDAHLVRPFEWTNLWVYGMKIILAGWLTHEEFHCQASLLNAGMPTFQLARTRTKNLLVPLPELHPMDTLFDHVRAWEEEKRNIA
jgi:hypothetical protein